MSRGLPLPDGDISDVTVRYSAMSHAHRIVQPYLNAPQYNTLRAVEPVESTTYVLDGGQPDTLVESSDWINAGDLDGGDI